jgi:A/G-specific adenine glycosylase
VRRKADANRWANLWELPHTELLSDETPEAGASRLGQSLGFAGEVLGDFMTIQHGVTRFRITLRAVEMHWTSGEVVSEEYAESRWVSATELSDFPTSSPQRKLWKELQRRGQQLRLF